MQGMSELKSSKRERVLRCDPFISKICCSRFQQPIVCWKYIDILFGVYPKAACMLEKCPGLSIAPIL